MFCVLEGLCCLEKSSAVCLGLGLTPQQEPSASLACHLRVRLLRDYELW
jgi:hypothetical protein